MTELALAIAGSGMTAQEKKMTVNAGNIANMNSAAYSAQLLILAPLPPKNEQRAGSINTADGSHVPSGIQIPSGVHPVAVIQDLRPGPQIQTGNDYHLAINGPGYFHIKLPSGGDAYTRAGVFTLDQDGTLVTLQGYKVQPEIKIPINTLNVTITPQGEVMAKIDGQLNLQSVGNIELATFANPGGLEHLYDNFYQETQVSGTANVSQPGSPGFGTVLQHWYEGSNVNAITAVTELIATQRAYEMNTKVLEAADKMMEAVKYV